MAGLLTNKKVYTSLNTNAMIHFSCGLWWEPQLIPTLLLNHMDLRNTLPVVYSTEDPGALGTAWADG